MKLNELHLYPGMSLVARKLVEYLVLFGVVQYEDWLKAVRADRFNINRVGMNYTDSEKEERMYNVIGGVLQDAMHDYRGVFSSAQGFFSRHPEYGIEVPGVPNNKQLENEIYHELNRVQRQLGSNTRQVVTKARRKLKGLQRKVSEGVKTYETHPYTEEQQKIASEIADYIVIDIVLYAKEHRSDFFAYHSKEWRRKFITHHLERVADNVWGYLVQMEKRYEAIHEPQFGISYPEYSDLNLSDLELPIKIEVRKRMFSIDESIKKAQRTIKGLERQR